MCRIVLIAGGYRSGSTLQYNLLGEYLEHAGLGERVGYVNPDDADAFVDAVRREEGFRVAKCHQIAQGFHQFERSSAWGEIVRRGDAIAVSTERATADTERSMCRKFGIDPAGLHSSHLWRENEANVAQWHPLLTITQHYDDLTRRPALSLGRLTRAVGAPVRWGSVRHAAKATSVERVRAHQRDIPDGTWDPVTLVHWNHVAD